jgi:hypothetical protein
MSIFRKVRGIAYGISSVVTALSATVAVYAGADTLIHQASELPHPSVVLDEFLSPYVFTPLIVGLWGVVSSIAFGAACKDEFTKTEEEKTITHYALKQPKLESEILRQEEQITPEGELVSKITQKLAS